MAGFLSGLNSPSTTPSAAPRSSGGTSAATGDVLDSAGLSGQSGGSGGNLAPDGSNGPASDGGADVMSQMVQMRAPSSTTSTAPDLTGAGLFDPNASLTGGGSGAASGSATQLINDAKSYLGTPYVYGGTSKSGIDCSGFTQAAYSALGINIGRDTTAQYQQGTAVGNGNLAQTQAQLQPGDLLFYGQPGASGPNAHVVMYIGNGQVIQAGGKNVNIMPVFGSASSDEPFLGARRYLQAGSTTPTIGSNDIQSFLGGLKQQESGGNYAAHNPSGAGGAYQFEPSTWNSDAKAAGEGQYANGNAAAAPSAVQDAVAKYAVQQLMNQFGGNLSDVAKAWYAGPGFAQDNQTANQTGGPSIDAYAQSVLAHMAQMAGG